VTFCSLSHSTRSFLAGIAAASAVALTTTNAQAEAALLVDAASGRVLYAENATVPWYPASVTKVMTAYVILKAAKEGRISLDKLLTVSENAVAQQPSKMGFPKGTTVTVDNALKMLMVKSANDMAVVLAEGMSGSVEDFSTEMNRAAQRLGMTQTSYVNPNGLPADEQITSARDLAILGRAVINELPEYELYFRISAIKFGKRVMRNYNTLIDRYPGADGMKTGFICASGFNLMATATRGGRRLIAVVLGSRSGLQRAEKAAALLERGFTGGGGLSWLLPASMGTVEALQPVNTAPPNLREDICGPKGGKRRPRSDNEEEPVAHTPNDTETPLAMVASFQLGPRPQGSLLGPLTPSMAPIPVYAGLAKQPANLELASAPAAPKKKKAKQPGTETATATGTPAAKPAAPKQAAAAAAAPKQAAAAPAQGSAGGSGNIGARIVPAGLRSTTETKPADPAAAAKPKAKPKAKPVAAQQQ
jgi:D-alanyl-D-alanine carboxypeptidase